MVATGITSEGGGEILGVDIGDSEDATFWTGFLRSLKARGLTGVRLVISDPHEGLKKAIRKCFQGASWQRSSVNMGDEQDVPARCFRRRERTLAARPFEVQRQTCPSAAQDLLQRRTNSGNTKKEAMRVLKRRLSEVTYRAMLKDAKQHNPESTCT